MIEVQKYNGDIGKLADSGRRSKYPWKTMNVGECFTCNEASVRITASSASRRYGKKFATRKQDDGTFLVVRIA